MCWATSKRLPSAHRLKKLGLDDVIPYSFACDQVKVVAGVSTEADQGVRGSSTTS